MKDIIYLILGFFIDIIFIIILLPVLITNKIFQFINNMI